MEKYFQGPKAKGAWMVNFSPWHFQFEMFQYETAINCSFFCFANHHPSWRKPLAAAPITPQIFVRCWWKLQHALVPGKKPCCYQKESSLGFLRIQRCCSPVVGASVNSIFCWQIFCKTVVQHLGLCVVLFWFQDIQQFGEMLHGFKHGTGSAESHVFFWPSKIVFLFSPRSDSILCYFQDALKPMTGCGVSIASFTSFLMSREEI